MGEYNIRFLFLLHPIGLITKRENQILPNLYYQKLRSFKFHYFYVIEIINKKNFLR